jgi:hypothetical protein
MTEATAAAAADRRREKEEILDHNSPQILVLFSLSLSLFSPQKHKKNKRRIRSKALSCKWSTPHKTKTTKAKKLVLKMDG